MKCKDICMYNLSQVCCRSGMRMTIEQLQAKKSLIKERLLKNKRRMKKQKYEDQNNKLTQYDLLIEAFLFIAFILIFVLLSVLILKTSESHAVSKSVQVYLKQLTFNDPNNSESQIKFSQIKSIEQLKVWAPEFINLFKNTQTGMDQINNYYYRFGLKRLRMTLRYTSLNSNEDKNTSGIIKSMRSRQNFQPKSTTNQGEVKAGANYIGQGIKGSAFRAGGFVYTIDKNQKSGDVFRDSINPFLSQRFGSLTLQFVTYNPNVQYAVISSVILSMTALGTIKSQVEVNYLQTDIYEGKRNARIIVQALYIMLVIYYFIQEIMQWLDKEAEIRHNLNQQKRKAWVLLHGEEPMFVERKRFQRFIIYLGLNYNLFCEDSFIVKVFKVLIGLFMLVPLYIFYFIRISLLHLFDDFFNMLDTTSIILSAFNLTYWFQIVHNYTNLSNTDDISQFEIIGQLYQKLKLVMGINSLIIFLRILQFFKFNKRLSILSDVISEAASDSAFFLLMFIIILLGFSIWGNTIFGLKDQNFSNVFNATHSCFKMIIGDFDYDELKQSGSEEGLVPFFFITFMVLFNLLLLNMFIAIIGSHYQEIYKEMKQEQIVNPNAKRGMCHRVRVLCNFRLYEEQYKIMKVEKQQFRKCIFFIRCCGKGNQNAFKIKKYIKKNENQRQSKCRCFKNCLVKLLCFCCCCCSKNKINQKLKYPQYSENVQKSKYYRKDSEKQLVENSSGSAFQLKNQDSKSRMYEYEAKAGKKMESSFRIKPFQQNRINNDEMFYEQEKKIDSNDSKSYLKQLFYSQRPHLDQGELKKMRQIIDFG